MFSFIKNKKIVIILIFLFLIFLSTNCFASTELDYKGIKYILPDNLTDNYHIGKNTDGYYFLFVGPNGSSFKGHIDNGHGFYYDCFDKDGNIINGKLYFPWVKGNVSTVDFSNVEPMDYKSYGIWKEDFIYTSYGIFYRDGTIFFFSPVRYQIPAEMAVEQIPEVVKAITIILVPIGLTIFCILLVVYLIASRKWLKL